jgi:hypothetical protein
MFLLQVSDLVLFRTNEVEVEKQSSHRTAEIQ